ncbi:MAG: hypothetical protein KF819_05125 [Labilithrix sp.]|nr:hypothetical protein [Labilithrix sp.]
MRAASIARGIAALTALSGCALFTSLDGFSEPDEPAVVDDGGPLVEESGPAPDAGVEAGGGFCASAPSGVFCADFDQGALADAFEINERRGATVRLDGAEVRSAPSAVLFTVPPSSRSTGASLRRVLAPATTDVTIELDVRVDQMGQGSSFDLLTVVSGGAEVGLQLNPDGTASWDEDTAGAPPRETTIAGVTVAAGAWIHLRWTSRIEGATAPTELRVDGNLVGSNTFEATALTDVPAFFLGDQSMSNVNGEWRVRVDNLTVEVR